MIRIDKDYMIDPHWIALRHFHHNILEDSYSRVYGYTVRGRKCGKCFKETPQKILFIYNLWKFHNG